MSKYLEPRVELSLDEQALVNKYFNTISKEANIVQAELASMLHSLLQAF